MRLGDITAAVGANGQQQGWGTGGDVDFSVPKQWWNAGVHPAVDHSPQFLAAVGFVGNCRHRPGYDHLGASLEGDHPCRAVGLLDVAVVGLVVDVAIVAPDGLAGPLVESHDELVIVSVEGHEQQVAVNRDTRAGASPVVAFQVLPLPDHPAGFGVQAGGAQGTEGDVDPTILDVGCGRGVAVEGVAVLWFFVLEERLVVQDLAGLAVQAQ